MRYTYEVGGYNTRRYGKPWIAKITDWPVGSAPTLSFGHALDAYCAEIEAEPGQILRWGQKDHRGNGTISRWGIAMPDGSVRRSDARECREHWSHDCPVLRDEVEGDNVGPFRAGGETA